MKTLQFTEDEAQEKVGWRVRSLSPFSGAAAGTEGTVVAVLRIGEGYHLAVQWDCDGMTQGRPLRDWFTRDEYERFLEEIHD